MEYLHCLHDDPAGTKSCKSGGSQVQSQPRNSLRKCVSCGKHMSHEVHFTVCQHCGFTYEIKVSKPNGSHAITTWTYFLIYFISFLVPLAGLLIGGAYMSDARVERGLGKDCAVLGVINLIFVAMLAYYLGG